MQLLKQKERWSCGFASLAMFLGISEEKCYEEVGHNGSEIWFPGNEEPANRRGLGVQEILDVALRFGDAMLEIPVCWSTESLNLEPKQTINEERVFQYMRQFSGLLIGRTSINNFHMVAWRIGKIYDPMIPEIREFQWGDDPFTVDIFLSMVPTRRFAFQ